MKLFGLEITKAKVSSSGGGSRSVPLEVTSSPWERVQGEVSHDDYGSLLKQYKNWVYVGVFKNSVAVARYPIKLYARKKKKETKVIVRHKNITPEEFKYFENSSHLRKFTIDTDAVVEITEHPILDLFNKVNPQMTKFDLFSKTDMFLELTGNVYWYLVLNKLKQPEQIWPLSPVNIKVKIKEGNTSGEFVDGYVYKTGTVETHFKKEEIIHFTFPSPFSNIYGLGPLAAGQASVKFDHTSREYENILLDNQCRPDVVLTTDQTINDTAHTTLIGRLRNAYAGRRGLGKWMILDKGLKATPLNLPLREMGFVQGRKASKEEIAGILGVPVSKLTTEDVNLANAYVGEMQYIKDTIAPRLVMIEEKLNETLVPMFDENLFLSYGDVVPADRNYRLLETEKHLTTSYSSINEERKKDGLDPVEWGEKPMAIQQAEQAQKAAETAAAQAPGQEQTEENPFEDESIPQQGKPTKKKHWIDVESDREEMMLDIINRVQRRIAIGG